MVNPIAGGFKQMAGTQVGVRNDLAHSFATDGSRLRFSPGEERGPNAAPPPRGMDIGLRTALADGCPSNQLIRRLDHDHGSMVGRQIERLLDVGGMDLGHTVIRDLAGCDEGSDARNVGACRGTGPQPQGLGKYHRSDGMGCRPGAVPRESSLAF